MIDQQKRTWTEINLENIEYNMNAVKAVLPQSCKYLGVVKGNAYGHGAPQVAHRLEKAGADYLAVANIDEAIELRKNGVALPILILGHTPPEFCGEIIANKLTQTITSEAKAVEYSQACEKYDVPMKVHIKVDTGMSRLGYLCTGRHFGGGVEGIVKSCRLPNLFVEGIYTHFSVADSDNENDKEFTEEQYRLFCAIIQSCEDNGVSFPIKHCANTGAVVNYPHMCLDMVRPGLSLYGYGGNGIISLKPVMKLITTVSTIKIFDPGIYISYGRKYQTESMSRIGVLGIGYADGLFRSLSNKCSFWTEDGFAEQRGTICMDMCMIDLNDKPNVKVGSQIEIFGDHSSLEKISEIAGTIPYELMCSITRRVPRIYIN